MNLIQLSEHCYCSTFDRDYDRPRLGYVHSQGQAIMIDAGNSPAHLTEFLTLIQEANLPLPQMMILTHWHWDHVFGLVSSHVSSICTQKTQAKLKMMQAWKWDDEAMRHRVDTGEDIAFCDEYMRKEYLDPQTIQVVLATNTFDTEHKLKVGDLDLTLRWIDNDHSDDACVVHIEQDKILFLGDIYTENYHNGPPHYTQTKLRALVSALEKIDFKLAIHGHDRFRYNDELIQELHTILDQLDKKKD